METSLRNDNCIISQSACVSKNIANMAYMHALEKDETIITFIISLVLNCFNISLLLLNHYAKQDSSIREKGEIYRRYFFKFLLATINNLADIFAPTHQAPKTTGVFYCG